VLLEENVFDHNGWRIQQRQKGRREYKDGQAAYWNHNTYFCNCHDTAFRGNVFLRAASIGNKWTANRGKGRSGNIVIDDNLYVEGELGITIGGNTPGPLRFTNARITNNVMLDIGRSRPAGRSLAWYLSINDWDGGLVAGNLFLHQASDEVKSVYGVRIGNHTQHGRYKGKGIHCRNVTIRNNNSHYTDAETSQWFCVGGEACGLEAWTKKSGEQSAVRKKIAYPDPNRTVETYNASLGGKPTFDGFIREVRKQSKTNWRKEYTAAAVNAYVREGFGVKMVSPASSAHLAVADRAGRVARVA
jgi:hypothetical protein